MRILVLSDKVLSRRLGDGLRVHGLLKPLAQKHQFDLICFSRGTEELDPDLRGIFQSVTLIPAPEQRRSPLLRRMFKSISAGNFKLTSEAMRKTVEEAIRSRNYDLILEEAANTVPNLPAGPLGAPLIVDSIDEPLLRELRALRHAPLLDRPEHLYRAWRFWLYERAMLTRASVNVYVSEVDAAIYTRCFPGRRTAVVPNGVDTEYFAPMQIDPDGSYVVFEGNMNFEPNVDTARVLVQEILPRLRRRVAHARIGLVGRNPTDAVRALASDQVDVTGTVEDVRPYLARAAVFACPMRLGSGIKNKILQAWAMARPVVATSASLGGISARDNVNILVRDDPQEFADAVAELMVDRQRAASLGVAGRTTVEAQYSWHMRSYQLDQLFSEIAGAAASPVANPAMSTDVSRLTSSAKEVG
jgi:glycosyltransferase involved in cell wall biosynthesis